MGPSAVGIGVAACAAVCWGCVYATAQRLLGPGRFTSIELLAACFYGGAFLLLPVLWYYRTSFATAEQEALPFGLLLITLIVAEYLVFYSVQLLGGTEASLVQVSYPVWTATYLFAVNGEVPSGLTLLGALLIFSGVAFIVKYGGNNPDLQSTVILDSKTENQFILAEGPTVPSASYDTI